MDYSSVQPSVVGGLIVIVLAALWREVLPRLLQRFFYDEPRLPPNWKTTYEEGEQDYHENVTLTQNGRRVTGEVVLREGEDKTTYKFEGTFRHLFLTATYQSTDPADYEQGAFALRYKRNGTFVGQHVLLSNKSEELVSSRYEWIPD